MGGGPAPKDGVILSYENVGVVITNNKISVTVNIGQEQKLVVIDQRTGEVES